MFKGKFRIVAVICFVLFGVMAYLSSQMSFGPRDKILPGIYVLNVKLSRMDRDQAIQAMKKMEASFKQARTIQYRELSWSLPMDQVGLRLNYEEEVERAMSFGRTGSLWQQFLERREAHRSVHLKPEIHLDANLLEKTVTAAAETIILPPRDAGLIINDNDTVEISPGREGRLVDINHLQQELIKSLLTDSRSPIPLKLVVAPPVRSTEEVSAMGINRLLAMYSTQFDPNKVNRAYNVSVAAAALDGLTVAPREVMSFNEVVGPRSTEAGYKTAPIIVNNELVDGLGGGVCQVSTTLYNAVLLANLEVVERTNHSMPITYVPIGRDATVVFDAIDFKFRNNTDYWLYIQSHVKGGTLVIKIFGNEQFKKDVVIRSWIEETYNPDTLVENDYSIRMGDRLIKQKGAQGYRVSAERVVMEKGQVVKVEKLPTSVYKARNQIISQGMAPPGDILSNPELPADDSPVNGEMEEAEER
ncbi:VanW family protein [Desulforamulus ruminis]|uniref:VanW family protein n=1 Tax=Desulforamulus ruminis (strain ATCC 23193 / DSM 2154 / NCIMB 8452 / DL) TaxID=696281 RepID=F6DUW8_DESRL|nr:VanW family protein [Desulforamulus ruminis]AEG61365.1 VanW family protein [Desulforamulus ruminis DSM 2154]